MGYVVETSQSTMNNKCHFYMSTYRKETIYVKEFCVTPSGPTADHITEIAIPNNKTLFAGVTSQF